MNDTIYTHIEKGGRYRIIRYFRFQIENTWVDAVLYTNDKDVYGRTLYSFNERFKVVGL